MTPGGAVTQVSTPVRTAAPSGRAARGASRKAPAGRNLAIGGAVAALNVAQFVALPLLLLPLHPATALVLVPAALSAPTHWALVHEAIHGSALPDRAWNDRFGRVLAGLFGSPFQLLRLGHLMHHRFNRTPLNRSEVVEPPLRPGCRRRAAYYARLFGGLWLGELLAAALAVLPDIFYRPIVRLAFGDEAPDGRSMWAAARRQLLEEPGRSRMRLDGALITAGLAGSFWLYGPHWPLLAAALGARALIVSFLDNVYHYGAPLDDVMAGYDLAAPRAVSVALLHFNHHASHHREPSAPWTALPEVARRRGVPVQDSLLRAALAQLRGPLTPAEIAAARTRVRAGR
jgi:fatty acid desaturase